MSAKVTVCFVRTGRTARGTVSHQYNFDQEHHRIPVFTVDTSIDLGNGSETVVFAEDEGITWAHGWAEDTAAVLRATWALGCP